MNLKRLTVAAVLASSSLLSVSAFAADVKVDGKGEIPYVIDGRNVVARSGSDLCWRTGFWSPAAAASAMAEGGMPAGCACDSDIVPKDKCAAPKAATPAATPAAPAAAPTAPAAPAAAAKAINLGSTVLFDFDKSVLKPEGKAALDKDIVNRMKEIGTVKMVTVSGHSDRLGSAQYNQKLSEKRAEAVKSYLIGKGVGANLIETFGYGKTQPVPGVTCGSKLSRAALIKCLEPNRRVVVDVK